MSPPAATPLEFFDRVYVVNLPERTDRRRQMERELVRAKMPLTAGKVEIFPAIRPADKDGFPSIGACGCFRSHLSIFKLALQHNARNVLMIEDDLNIADQFGEQFASIAQQLNATSWSFAYFGHVLELPKSRNVRMEPTTPETKLMTTHFYAASGAILPRLIDFLEQMQRRPPGDPRGGPMHVDGALSTFRRQNPDAVTLVAHPNLGFQRSSRSDVATRKWVDRYPGAKQLAALVRGVAGRWRGR
jgi:hypothetical protein